VRIQKKTSQRAQNEEVSRGGFKRVGIFKKNAGKKRGGKVWRRDAKRLLRFPEKKGRQLKIGGGTKKKLGGGWRQRPEHKGVATFWAGRSGKQRELLLQSCRYRDNNDRLQKRHLDKKKNRKKVKDLGRRHNALEEYLKKCTKRKTRGGKITTERNVKVENRA